MTRYKIITLVALLTLYSVLSKIEAQNIGINSTGASPNTSAALDINMTNKGLLIPRVALASTSDAAAITSPATSLLVYNTGGALTPEGYYYNQGTSGTPNWIPFLTNNVNAPSAWSLTGNTGTTAGTNFIGTTDAVAWVVKTGGTEALRVSSNGNVGISSSGTVSRRLYLAGGAVTSALGGAFWIDSDNTAAANDAGQILLNANGSDSDESRIVMRNNTRGVYASIEGVPTAVSDGGLNFVSRNSGVYVNAMSIINNGNVGIGTTAPGSQLHVNKAYTTNASNTSFKVDVSNTATISGSDAVLRGGQFNVTNTQTESGVNSSAYGLDVSLTTGGALTYNWLRGGNFWASSSSTSASNQDNIAGVYASGYNNGSGTITSVFGNYTQGFINSSGTVTNLYGTYSRAIKNAGATGNITNAYGLYAAVNNNHTNGTGAIGSAYALYGAVSRDASSASFTDVYGSNILIDATATATNDAYGVYATLAGDASNNIYAFRANIAGNATNDEYGIYLSGEDKNYFSNNVGIGVISPQQKLHIANAVTAGTLADAKQVLIGTNENPDWNLRLGYYQTGASQPFAGVLQSIDGGTGSYLLLNPSGGNVGIGTTSPSQRLDIVNVGLPTTSTSRLANIEAYNAGDALLWGHTNTLASASLGSKSGNGAAYLQFFAYHSNNANNSRYTGNPYGGGDIAYPGRMLSDDGTSNNVFTFESGDAPGQDNEITWTKRMVINQNGNVGIGTTSPDYELDLEAATFSTLALRVGTEAINNRGELFFATGTGSDANTEVIGSIRGIITQATPSALKGAMEFRVNVGDNTNPFMYAKDDGNVGIGTVSPTQRFHVYNGSTNGTYTTTGWAHSSDRRLKTNISTIENSLEKVLQLDGVYYNWKTEPSKNRQIGFIAQDVEPILPEAVIKDSDGNYSLSYGNLTSVLVNAIKDLSAISEEQKQIINIQSQEIKALKTENAKKVDYSEHQKLKTEIEKIKAVLNQQTSY